MKIKLFNLKTCKTLYLAPSEGGAHCRGHVPLLPSAAYNIMGRQGGILSGKAANRLVYSYRVSFHLGENGEAPAPTGYAPVEVYLLVQLEMSFCEET